MTAWGTVRRRRLARRWVRAAAACFVSLAVLLGVLRGGRAVYFCPSMGALLAEPCCGAPHHDDDGVDAPVARVEAPDCCESRRLGAMPHALGAAPERVVDHAPRVLATVLCRADDGRGASGADRPPALAHVRPPPPRPGERRAQLMVFHL